FLVASGYSAYFWTRLARLSQKWSVRLLAGLVLWEVIQIVPVQLLAAIQMTGFISRVSMASLAALQVCLLAGSAVWFWMRRPSLSPRLESPSVVGLPTYVRICAGVLAGSYCLFALNALTSFPAGSDALIYHLPLASRWLQEGSLDMPATGAWRFSLPGNAETMMMVLLASGKQSDVVAVNCVAAFMLALSSYLLAMSISKGNKAASAVVTLIVLSVPMVEFQTFSAYVDLIGTAAICAAFALLVSAGVVKKTRPSAVLSPVMLLISALACGISLGTKPVFYFYALMWVAFLGVILWQKRTQGMKAILNAALLAGFGLILPSGFWFARAAIRTGNPVYPIQVTIGHHVLFRGLEPSQITDINFEQNFVRRPREWLIYPWTEWKRNPGYLMIPYTEGSGVGAAFATFVPLGLAFLLFRLLLRGPGYRVDFAVLLLFGLGVLAWSGLMQRVPRFALPLTVFACVLSAPMVAVLQMRRKKAFRVLLVISVLATSAVSSFVPFHALAGRIRTGEWSRAGTYSYPKLIDSLSAGSRVLNASGVDEKNFALEGAALTNHVVTDFEAPSELTPESLRATDADFVAEIIPGGKYSAASLASAGARVVADDFVLAGEDRVHWRIWHVEKLAVDNGTH
ncbi:MAG: hypothetical protein QOF94_840, partial [Acidobacteriaceae bacterium]